MIESVCFKCGHGRTWALSACKQCGSIPLTEDELSLSLVLCEHLSSKSQLAHFAHEIKNGLRLTAPENLHAQAREALKDPQLLVKLGVRRQPHSHQPRRVAILKRQLRLRNRHKEPHPRGAAKA